MKGKSRLTKQFKYAVNEEGTFEGLLATYNNIDLGGDLIEPGAFTKSLQENGNVIPLLWQHDSRSPIGSLTVTDSTEGLSVAGQILTDTSVGDYAYKTLKGSAIKGLSIGYDTVKSVWEGSVRRLKEIRLWEGSVVTFPMDTHAMVLSVKAAREQKDDFNTELAEAQLRSAGYQMMSALEESLYSVLWSNLAKPDQISMAQTSIQQFSDAYMAWLPDYLDWLSQEYGSMEVMSRKINERKEGRMISGNNKKILKSAHEQITGAAELLLPLCTEEAGSDDDTTSKGKAGRQSEPEAIHSAAKILDGLRSLIPQA